MPTMISPMLAVSDGNAAIDFYARAFGATVLWHLDGGGHIVAGLEIDGAPFFLAHESPEHGTRSPRPITRMLQGSVVDPFGHKWLIGKFLD